MEAVIYPVRTLRIIALLMPCLLACQVRGEGGVIVTVPPTGRLEAMAAKPDLIFKAEVLSITPTNNPAFEVSGMELYATKLKVISVLQGSTSNATIVFEHYRDWKPGGHGWSGGGPPACFPIDVPIGQRAALWVERYLQETRPRLCLDTRTQALFLTGYGGPFNPDVLSRMVTEWVEKAGLPKKGSCHLLRHTCATHMLEGGADIRYIQQLLGHEKLDTTAIYTEVSIKQLQEVHARCHPSSRLETPAK